MAQSPCTGSVETAQGLLGQGDQDVGFWVEAGPPAGTWGPVTSRGARDLPNTRDRKLAE